MKVIIATHNPAKLKRYYRMLNTVDGIELVSLSDLQIAQKVDEPFSSAKENAVYKAKEYASFTGLPTLSIDEAVSTNFLPENEQPGVYVRRFADKNHEMTDEEALLLWRKILANSPQQNKEFIWDYSIAFYNPEHQKMYYTKAINVARVAHEFSKTVIPGYPMSSFMIYQGTDRPNAELSETEKLEADKKIFKEFIAVFPEWIKG